MKKVLCTTFLVFLLFSSISFAQEIPTLHKYVNDLANVLSASDESRINTLCAEIENNWTIEIAVLTVDTTQPMSIEEYAVETFEKNGIGKADKDNGLLIVAAIQDREWRLEVGYGLEPIINDAKAGLIGRTYITPAFKEQKYGDGLYNAVAAVGMVIERSGDTSFISENNLNIDTSLIISIILLIFFLIIPVIFLINRLAFSQKCPRCGTRMNCYYKGDGNIICDCPKCGKRIKKKKKAKHFWFFVGGFGGHGGGFGGGGGGGFGGGGSGGGGSGRAAAGAAGRLGARGGGGLDGDPGADRAAAGGRPHAAARPHPAGPRSRKSK